MRASDLVTWVQWTGTTRAHAGIEGVRPDAVRNGSFPLECGRWAPDAWDAELWQAPNGRKCERCRKAAEKRYERKRAEQAAEPTPEEQWSRFTGYRTVRL